jgi:hypothetical protein
MKYQHVKHTRRRYLAMAIDLTDGPLPENVDLGNTTDWRKILKLDCLDRPGLSELEFLGLFAKCNVCKLVMACQVFSFHYCVLQTEESWELTDVEE